MYAYHCPHSVSAVYVCNYVECGPLWTGRASKPPWSSAIIAAVRQSAASSGSLNSAFDSVQFGWFWCQAGMDALVTTKYAEHASAHVGTIKNLEAKPHQLFLHCGYRVPNWAVQDQTIPQEGYWMNTDEHNIIYNINIGANPHQSTRSVHSRLLPDMNAGYSTALLHHKVTFMWCNLMHDLAILEHLGPIQSVASFGLSFVDWTWPDAGPPRPSLQRSEHWEHSEPWPTHSLGTGSTSSTNCRSV